MAAYDPARKEMAREAARVRDRGNRDSRLEALKRIAQVWRRKTAVDKLEKRLKEREKIHEEFQRWQRGGKKSGPPAPEEGTPPQGTKLESNRDRLLERQRISFM